MKRKKIKLKSSYIFFLIYCLINVYSYFSFLGKLPGIRLTIFYIPMFVFLLIRYLTLLFCSKKLETLEMIGLILLVWISILHLIWYPEIIKNGGSEEFWKNAANTFLLTWFMWLLGTDLGLTVNELKNSKNNWRLLCPIFIVYTISFFYGVILGYKNYGVWVFIFKNYETGQLYNYLQYGDTYVFLSFLTLWMSRNLILKLFVYIISSIALLLSYSRTSFYLYVLWGIIFLIFELKDYRKFRGSHLFNYIGHIGPIFVLGLIWGLAYLIAKNPQLYNVLFVKRMFSILINPLEDESLRARIILFSEGLYSINENWLFGRYMDEWWRLGNRGEYIHNWLSFLAAYGIGPFLIFVVISISIFIKSFCALIKGREILPIIVFGFSITAIIFSRSYVWFYIWFSIGFVSSFKIKGNG